MAKYSFAMANDVGYLCTRLTRPMIALYPSLPWPMVVRLADRNIRSVRFQCMVKDRFEASRHFPPHVQGTSGCSSRNLNPKFLRTRSTLLSSKGTTGITLLSVSSTTKSTKLATWLMPNLPQKFALLKLNEVGLPLLPNLSALNVCSHRTHRALRGL